MGSPGGAGTALTRLDMARDILHVRQGLERAPAARQAAARVLAGRRIAAIRRALLGRPGATLADELLSPSTGYPKLVALLDQASEADRPATEIYVREIYALLRGIESIDRGNGLRDALTENAATGVLRALPDKRGDREYHPLVGALTEAGMPGDDVLVGLALAAEQPGDRDIRIEDIDPELAARYSALIEKYNFLSQDAGKAHVAHLNELNRVKSAVYGRRNKEYIEALEESAKILEGDWAAAAKKVTDLRSESLDALQSQVDEAIKSERERRQEPFRAAGAHLIDSLKQSSPVTQAQAAQWAKTQEITKTAAARLKKLGYPIDQVRADMAEFYHLTGGRVPRITVDSAGARRANAGGIASVSADGAINLGSSFNKRVLWHELAHHLEADPVARAAAGVMVRSRAEGQYPVSLRKLSGHNGYRPDEEAWKDSFFDHYVGKRYSDGVTEVFSMGIESFSDPLLLGKRMAKDPDTLAFVAGFIKGGQNELATALMALKLGSGAANNEYKEKSDATVDRIIKRLADSVAVISAGSELPWMEKIKWYFTSQKMELIGKLSINGVEQSDAYLFSGRVTSTTKRKVKGLIVVRSGSDLQFPIRSEQGFPTTDQTVVKAAAAIFAKTGRFPNPYYDMTSVRFLEQFA